MATNPLSRMDITPDDLNEALKDPTEAQLAETHETKAKMEEVREEAARRAANQLPDWLQ